MSRKIKLIIAEIYYTPFPKYLHYGKHVTNVNLKRKSYQFLYEVSKKGFMNFQTI